MSEITSFAHKDLPKQIKSLYKRGGHYQKASSTLKQILYDIQQGLPADKVFKNIPVTKNGESRIKHSVKYIHLQFLPYTLASDM